MKFLLDQDVYLITGEFLKKLRQDVILVSEIGHAQSSDQELLTIARNTDRIFITRDRDFGELIFLKKYSVGVIYLRILPSTIQSVHHELEEILISYKENDLKNGFVVVEPGRHRFRKLKDSEHR
ncbi:MAG: DUF5615 family PIN-like protein [Bacteroidota bacterium]|nr:DUF5615 family PIN-like protein [Bacteroidota bacterium]